MSSDIEVLCPRCKVPMNFYSRTERTSKSDGLEIKVTRYFKCPVCGRSIVDEVLEAKVTSDGLRVTSKHNGLEKLAIVRRVSHS